MNLVDSCGWMEYFCGTGRAMLYAPAIEKTENLVVPSICFYEVFKKILGEAGEQEALRAVAAMRLGKEIPLDDSLAITAALVSRQYAMPMADAIVVASSRLTGATIWTQDAHFEKVPGVKLFRK